MQISMFGCGRWGTLIAWYLDSLHHTVTLYGRPGSPRMTQLMQERKNDLLTLPESVHLTTDLIEASSAPVLLISIGAQNLRGLLSDLAALSLEDRTVVLCMKGLEEQTGYRLSEIAAATLSPSNRVAVWLGPGHVQAFCAGIPNCMVIDSADAETKDILIDAFSGPLIRFYYGNDLIGNEIGAAAKNVIGIAAGILDGLGRSTLKGALMSRGTREIARLIVAMGGKEQSAYGLCHLGDYEATLFSPYSHNRQYGEARVTGAPFDKLAEGHATAAALHRLSEKYGVELPISEAVYHILYDAADPKATLYALLERKQKQEF